MAELSTLYAILPAAFGFLGTIAGAAVAWANGASPRYAEQDQRARAALLALQRLSFDELKGWDENEDFSEALWTAYYEAMLACASAGIPVHFFSQLVFPNSTDKEPFPSAEANVSPVDLFVAAQAGTVLLDLRRWRRKTKQEQSFALEASKEMRGWLGTLTGEDGDASSAQD